MAINDINVKHGKKRKGYQHGSLSSWELLGSNQRPSACKQACFSMPTFSFVFNVLTINTIMTIVLIITLLLMSIFINFVYTMFTPVKNRHEKFSFN